MKDYFPLICEESRCIFCLGDERKIYQRRTFNYSRSSKMMNEVDKLLRKFALNDKVLCPHPMCKSVAVVLPGVMAFKAHTVTAHKIYHFA